jgi:putative SOS response-associated peptidase YedK
MCGRFTLVANPDALAELFELDAPPELSPRYNIAPTQAILAVRPKSDGGGREAVRLRWGLVPSWAKEVGGPPLINARADTVADKPAFRVAFKQRRCLIPADGFYEWQATGGKKKQPFAIRLRDDHPFAFAGLWERWSRGEERVESCAIITTGANDLLRSIHDRMPVILPPSRFADWLDPTFHDAEQLQALLQPFPADQMKTYTVSTLVGNARNDDPRCLEPVAAP